MRLVGRPTVLAVVTCAALLACCGSAGTAQFGVAATGGNEAMIHGCYGKKSGNLRVIGPQARCLRSERAIAWEQQGPPGTPGVAGSVTPDFGAM